MMVGLLCSFQAVAICTGTWRSTKYDYASTSLLQSIPNPSSGGGQEKDPLSMCNGEESLILVCIDGIMHYSSKTLHWRRKFVSFSDKSSLERNCNIKSLNRPVFVST